MTSPRPCVRSASLAALLVLASAARSGVARAEDPPVAPPAVAPERDAAAPGVKPDPWAAVRRPWLYASDPSAPPPGHVLASLGVGYAPVDRGGAHPFAGNVAHAGAVFNAGAEVGVLRFLSLHGEGLLAGEPDKGVHGGGMLGVTFYPLPASSPVDLSLSGGYLRELGGGNGVWSRASIGASFHDARFVVTALGAHVFDKGRDAVDLLLTAGATYAVLPILHLGVEYSVQDLEGLWDADEVEGGVRHFLGPTASLQLARRVFLTAGPAFGLSKGSPTVLGRMAASYAF
jgi:hypothetical protein